MKRTLCNLSFLTTLFFHLLFSVALADNQAKPKESGALLIKLAQSVPQSLAEESLGSGLSQFAMQQLRASEVFRSATQLAEDFSLPPPTHFLISPTNSSSGQVMSADQVQFLKIDLAESLDVNQLLVDLNNDPRVEYAEREYIRYAFKTPNDPQLSEQYAHSLSLAQYGWDVSVGTDVKVAVVDTGVELTHPDLKDNILPGYDFANHDADPNDDEGHGTHCAGIIAARGDNSIGVAGVAWQAKIIPVKVLSASGSGSDADVAAGIRYAADQGAAVISLSLGGPYFSQTLLDAVRYAKSRDVVVVAAAGNDGTTSKSYPGAFDEVIGVGATDIDDKLAWFSNYGPWVDIFAPGVLILSTMQNGSYGLLSGTSMATPYIAGAAALFRAFHPTADATTVEEQMALATDDISNENPGNADKVSQGRINIPKLLSIIPQSAFRNIKTDFRELTGNNDGLMQPGESFSVDLRIKNLGGDATNIKILASTTSTSLLIDDGVSNFGNLLSGMSSGNEGDPIKFRISPSLPFGAPAGDLKLTTTVNGQTVSERALPIKASLPQLTGFPVSLGNAVTSDITIEDLEGDGSPEILFFRNFEIWVLTNRGAPVSGWPYLMSPNFYDVDDRKFLAIGNIVGDAKKEVIAVSTSRFVNADYPVVALSNQGVALPGWPRRLSTPVPYRDFLMSFGPTSPVLYDLNGDGLLDVVFGEGPQFRASVSSKIYGVNGLGQDLSGFPIVVGNKIEVGAAPVLADIDGDAISELGFVMDGESLALFRSNGNFLSTSEIGADGEGTGRTLGLSSVDPFGDRRRRITSLGRIGISLIGPTGRQERGFPSSSGLPGTGPEAGNSSWRPAGAGNVPIWGDFDGDGFFEGVFGASGTLGGQTRLLLNSIDVYGNAKAGFPVPFGDRSDVQLTGQILVHDLDGDGFSDFIVPFSEGVEVISSKGVRIPSWSFDFPKGCIAPSSFTPAITDLNNDGAIEIVFSCKKDSKTSLHALTFPGSKVLSPSLWPMYQHDALRSGAVPGSGRVPPTPTPRPTPVPPTPTPSPVPSALPTKTLTPNPTVSPTPRGATTTPTPAATVGAKSTVSSSTTPGSTTAVKIRWLSTDLHLEKKDQYVLKFEVAIKNPASQTLNCVVDTSVAGQVVTYSAPLKKVRGLKNLRAGELLYRGTLRFKKAKGMKASLKLRFDGIAVRAKSVKL